MAGSYGNSMFSHLRTGQSVFQSDCTLLHSHQQCVMVLISLHFYQLLRLSIFLVKWCYESSVH